VAARGPHRDPYAKLAAMVGATLLLCGVIAISYGSWRGYSAARSALLPLLRDGDETRALIDASRPLHARNRVRVVARNVALAVAWILVAMYGLYLATAGATVYR
jgi:hypothetical protein